jgi:hypothetical protein
MVETNSLKSHTPAPPRPARATPAHHANPQQPTRLTAGRLRPSRTAPVRRRPHPPDRTHQQRSRPPGAIGPAVTDTVACDPRCPRPLDSRASAAPLLCRGAESPYRRSSSHLSRASACPCPAASCAPASAVWMMPARHVRGHTQSGAQATARPRACYARMPSPPPIFAPPGS